MGFVRYDATGYPQGDGAGQAVEAGGNAQCSDSAFGGSEALQGGALVPTSACSTEDLEPCRGCRRNVLSLCFFVPDEKLEFRSGGSADDMSPRVEQSPSPSKKRKLNKHLVLFCKDCHNCWRTMFGTMGALPMFLVRLNQPENFIEWWQTLVAYMSLRSEGHAKITKQMITQRLATLRWVCALIRVPFYPFVVRPVRGRGEMVDPSTFIQMVDKSGSPCIGTARFYDAWKPLSEDSTVFSELSARGARLPDTANIQTESQEEKDMLNTRGIVQASASVSGSSGSPTESGSTIVGLPACRPIDAASTTAKMMLCATFESWTWDRLAKESTFTVHLTKIVMLKQTALGEGNKQDIDACDEWIEGLQDGKEFVKLFRIYQRFKKHSQLVGSAEKANELLDVMRSVGVAAYGHLTMY